MLTLGPSAAAAVELDVNIVELPPIDPAYDPFDPVAFYQRTESAQVVLSSGSTVSQWAKIRLGANGTLPNLFVRCSRAYDGSPSNTSGISIYTSSSDTEDGSTLSLVGGGYPEQLTYVYGSGATGTAELSGHASPKWLYISCSSDGAADEVGAFAATLIYLGQRAAGHGFVGVRHPDPIRGSTRLSQFYDAEDSIARAPDLSSGGIRLTGLNARWGAAMTHEDGEPTYTEPNFEVTYSRTDWHRIYVPAGTFTFTDQPAAGYLYGSIMAIYSGPANAGYSELTFMLGSTIISEPDGSYGMATLTITTISPTWLYIQHAYTLQFDGGSSDTYPLLSTSWAPVATHRAIPDPIRGHARVLSIRWAPNPIEGFTAVRARGLVTLPPDVGRPDQIYGSTSVTVKEPSYVDAVPDIIAGLSGVGIAYTPDLSGNAPIDLGVNLTGSIAVTPLFKPDPPSTPFNWREIAVVTIIPVVPTVVLGIPTTPAHVAANSTKASTLTRGPLNIRALGAGNIFKAPSAKPMVGHWKVDDLSVTSGLGVWPPSADTPRAPSWRSAAPFSPSVGPLALDTSGFMKGVGASEVDYPKAAFFNPQYVQHMWLDFGGPRWQPFTWIVTGVVTSHPQAYEHYVLDAGRNPLEVGFPAGVPPETLGADTPLSEGLAYRSLLSSTDAQNLLSSTVDQPGAGAVQTAATPLTIPRMLFGVFNGSSSMVGDYSAAARKLGHGSIPNTAAQEHRYYVMGRSQGIISQGKAASLAVFEVRMWSAALTLDELAGQYAELSSTYRFNQVGWR